MKKLIGILAVISIFASLPLLAQTSGFAEFESHLANGTASKEVHVYLEGTLPAKKLGWFSWTAVSKEWSQTYWGLAYKPSGWLTLETGYGLETADKSWRFGSSVLAAKGPYSAYFAYEDGGSGPWHKLVLNYSLNDRLGVGLLDQRYLGTGPRAELHINKFTAWGAVLWLDGHPTTTLALDYNF